MRLEATSSRGDFSTRLLTPEDLGDLQALFERSADYFELATGRGPAPDESQRAFVGGPPTKSVNDKRTIGIFRDGRMIGVLDAITDWPADSTWTMGMLLLEPGARNEGLGSVILAEYERWAGAEGARVFRTAVVAKHARGIRFLESVGYSREEERGGVIFLSRGGS